jgi:hypothetical protein
MLTSEEAGGMWAERPARKEFSRLLAKKVSEIRRSDKSYI